MAESQNFRQLFGDAVQIKQDEVTSQRASRKDSPGLRQRRADAQQQINLERNGLASEEHIPLINPHEQLSFKRDGVQHSVFKNLRLGKYQLDARLDLHHHRVEQARKMVFEFIRDCIELDIRSVLIIHGTGELRDKPALLKSCVNYWLKELSAVLAFHSAQSHHGGNGATYVMLRKSTKQKNQNSKQH